MQGSKSKTLISSAKHFYKNGQAGHLLYKSAAGQFSAINRRLLLIAVHKLSPDIFLMTINSCKFGLLIQINLQLKYIKSPIRGLGL
jgi:hypothetical protein